MASTSGAHAHASQLESLGADIAGYKREREQVMAKIEQLEQQHPTHENEKKLESLQQKEQRLLDLITRLQEEKNLLLRSSAGAAAGPAAALQAALKGLTVQDLITQSAQEAAAAAARQVQQLKEAIQQVEDEVRSVNSSHSLPASKISAPQLSMARQVLRIYVTPFDQTDPSLVLHADAGDTDYEWDNAPEPSQREAYMAVLQDNLGNHLYNKLAWKTQVKVDLVLYGLGHRVVSKSDELLVAKHWEVLPDAGCVIGIELKKNLTQASRRQGEAEFLAFSLSSNFPFMQLMTDMRRGGFAYYKQCDRDGQQVVVERVLQGMASFYDFLKAALADLPSVLTNPHTQPDVVQQLCNPERVKLYQPKLQGRASVYSDGPDCGDDALHELSDWFPNKEMLEATGELPDALGIFDQVAAVQ